VKKEGSLSEIITSKEFIQFECSRRSKILRDLLIGSQEIGIAEDICKRLICGKSESRRLQWEHLIDEGGASMYTHLKFSELVEKLMCFLFLKKGKMEEARLLKRYIESLCKREDSKAEAQEFKSKKLRWGRRAAMHSSGEILFGQ